MNGFVSFFYHDPGYSRWLFIMPNASAWLLNSAFFCCRGCCGGWTVGARLYEHGSWMEGESRSWERMRELSNTFYYFTHDRICAKGTAFVLTQNWGNHGKELFTHILWLFSKKGCDDDSSLFSLRGVSCQPARLGVGKWCLGKSTCKLSFNDGSLSVWLYCVNIKQGHSWSS